MRYELTFVILFFLRTSIQQTATCDELAALLGDFECVKNDDFRPVRYLKTNSKLLIEKGIYSSHPKHHIMVEYDMQTVEGTHRPFDIMTEFRKQVTPADDWIFHPDKTVTTESKSVLLFSNAKRLPDTSDFSYFTYNSGEENKFDKENKETTWNAILNIIKVIKKVHEKGYFFNSLEFELFFLGNDESDFRLMYPEHLVKGGVDAKFPDMMVSQIEPESLKKSATYRPEEATDIYSLGIMLYAMSNKGASPTSSLDHALKGEFQITAGMPLEVAYIVHGCMLKDRSKRFKLKYVEEIAKMALANPKMRFVSKKLVVSRMADFPEEERSIIESDMKAFAEGDFGSGTSAGGFFSMTSKMVLILLLLLLIVTVVLIVYFCIRKQSTSEADETNSNPNEAKTELVEVSAKD